MARQREFDHDEVLERAMGHFWQFGYESASLRDLLGTMGIGRQSLYNTFGDKHSLFLACLQHYRDRAVQSVIAPLRAPDGGLEAIEHRVRDAARSFSAQPRRACLILNSSMELAPHDPEVADITNGFIRDFKDGFAVALQVAVDRGEVDVNDIETTAWRLTNALMGMAPLGKAGAPADTLAAVAEQILDTLRR